MKFNNLLTILLVLTVVITASAGCFSLVQHNPEDYLTTAEGQHYYYEDVDGKSFYETVFAGDVTPYITGKNPTTWIQFVQNLPFIDDGKAGEIEIFRDVNETMSLGGGDCEDKSILMARGLKEMEVDSCIILQAQHVAVGVSKEQVDNHFKGLSLPSKKTSRWLYSNVNSDGYYVVETTANWGIGEYDEYPLTYEKMIVV